MNDEEILIVGAGPAGSAASLFLSKSKIPHVIVDKAIFPRDKICGDALSGKVVHILNKIDTSFVEDFNLNSSEYTGSFGISFYAPDGKQLDIPFSTNPSMLKNAPGFISRRINFDNYLFNRLDKNYARIETSTELTDIVKENDGVMAFFKNEKGNYQKKFNIVIGAEGDRSVVGRKLCPQKKNLSTYCASVRAYYHGVTGMHENKFIELHFIKDLLPGYFWIFPMNDGSANVGIGMLSEVVARKKINLRKKFDDIINSHPVISKRFVHATREGTAEGWGLPLGSARRTIAGENFLLTGDAASLIDPFTGEGIGNALHSGMLAAETAIMAVKEKRYDKQFLMEYENRLYHSLGNELRLSHGIQKLANHSWLFNLVVKKASKNTMLRETITCMFDDLDMRSRLKKPSFYFKLLFN